MSRRERAAGYSLVELMIVVGMLALVTTVAMPSLLRFLRSSEAQANARELATILSRLRQQAIKENCDIKVTRGTGGFTAKRQATCAAGAGTLKLTGMSSGSLYKASNGVSLAGPASLVFSRLGAASAQSTFTLTSSRYSTTMRVIVEASGRVRIHQ